MTQAGAAIYTPLLEVARSVLDRENSIGAFYRSAVWDAAAFIYTETCKMSSPAAVEALIRLGAMDAFEDFLCTNLSTWEALWLCDLPDETKPSSIIFAIRAICRSLDRGNRGK